MSLTLPWWSWISSASVQVACVFLVVFGIDRLVGKRAWPGLRSALWFVVMLELVVPPQWTAAIGFLPVPLGPSVGANGAAIQEATGFDWRTALAVLWLIGFVVQLGALAVRSVMLKRYLAGATRDDQASRQVRRAAKRIGLRRLPSVLVTEDGRGAAATGVLRSTLLLPRTLIDSGDLERIEHVILHELMHLRRRDPLVSLCLRILCAVYWFHPLVAWAERELAEARELACDAAVARALGADAPRYRNTLLRMAAELHLPDSARPNVPAVAFLGRRSEVLRRIESLSRKPILGGRTSALASFAVFGLLAACCVPGASAAPPAVVPEETVAFEPEGCMQVRFAFLQELARAQGLEP